MNRIVVDTDVASYLFGVLPAAKPFLPLLVDAELALSFMTVAELRSGAISAKWGVRRCTVLEQFIRGFEIVLPDDGTCSGWASVMAHSRSVGRAMSPQDGWIAATALGLDARLATNNRRHFEHVRGLRLLG